jgi:hypothetical protein
MWRSTLWLIRCPERQAPRQKVVRYTASWITANQKSATTAIEYPYIPFYFTVCFELEFAQVCRECTRACYHILLVFGITDFAVFTIWSANLGLFGPTMTFATYSGKSFPCWLGHEGCLYFSVCKRNQRASISIAVSHRERYDMAFS